MARFSGPGWRLIGRIARHMHLERWGGPHRLVAVLFHHVTDNSRWRADDPLIEGLKVDIPVNAFEHRMRWLTNRYEPVSLDHILSARKSKTDRAKLLVCFDDGYASVCELAAPILARLGVPWCFFLNGNSVGNAVLPVDNIVAYIANVHGLQPLTDTAGTPVRSAHQFIGEYLSGQDPIRRRRTMQNLAHKLDIDTETLARNAQLFVSEKQVSALAQSGVEIGNHTFDHVHCRTLNSSTAAVQIGENARKIERMSGKPAKAFAYPYGSLKDAIGVAREAVIRAGHKCAFVVQNRTNSRGTDRYALYRVDLGEMDDVSAALELEVLPRIRSAIATIRPGLN